MCVCLLGGGRGKRIHKGRSRTFTQPEELAVAEQKERREREWRVLSDFCLEGERVRGAKVFAILVIEVIEIINAERDAVQSPVDCIVLNEKSCMCFVDLQKDFDSVARKVLEWVMMKKGIPEVLVRSVMCLCDGAKSKF